LHHCGQGSFAAITASRALSTAIRAHDKPALGAIVPLKL
jgi:hypothetical protein